MTTLIRGGTVVNHDGIGTPDIAVRDGRIAAIGDIDPRRAGRVVDDFPPCLGVLLGGVHQSQSAEVTLVGPPYFLGIGD